MSNTPEGGLKVKAANLAKDPLYYVKMARRGGSVTHRETRVFYTSRELAREAGAKGGSHPKSKAWRQHQSKRMKAYWLRRRGIEQP